MFSSVAATIRSRSARGKAGIDHELPVDAGDTDLGNGTAERQVGGREGAGGGQAGEGVGLDVLLRGDEVDIHEDLQVEVIRPQGADRPVDQTGDEHLVVGGTAFTLEESAGEAACRIVLLAVVHGKRHEIRAFFHFFGTGDGGEQHGAAHFHHGGTGGLLGQLAGFDLDYPTVG